MDRARALNALRHWVALTIISLHAAITALETVKNLAFLLIQSLWFDRPIIQYVEYWWSWVKVPLALFVTFSVSAFLYARQYPGAAAILSGTVIFTVSYTYTLSTGI